MSVAEDFGSGSGCLLSLSLIDHEEGVPCLPKVSVAAFSSAAERGNAESCRRKAYLSWPTVTCELGVQSK